VPLAARLAMAIKPLVKLVLQFTPAEQVAPVEFGRFAPMLPRNRLRSFPKRTEHDRQTGVARERTYSACPSNGNAKRWICANPPVGARQVPAAGLHRAWALPIRPRTWRRSWRG
jgi:hypothetical protein